MMNRSGDIGVQNWEAFYETPCIENVTLQYNNSEHDSTTKNVYIYARFALVWNSVRSMGAY